MEFPLPPASESVLVLDRRAGDEETVCANLTRELPDFKVEGVGSLRDLRSRLRDQPFDLVILDYDLVGAGATFELLHELKTLDVEPSVLVVTASNEGHTINNLYRYGCDSCVVRDTRFFSELAPQVRHALRFRRLSENNRQLQARLVELNVILEEKNKRLDEFSATVAHDIRGPLSGLAMKLDFIVEQHGAEFDPRCQNLLKNSQRSVERLMEMVQGMYQFAKLGAQAEKMETFDLSILFEELANDLDLSQSKEVKIRLGDIPQIWGNKELLRRVFQNLLSNAMRYNDNQVVEINVRVDQFIETSLGKFARISVSDNGRGIPKLEIPYIFDLFRRGSSSRSEESGAGIGLAVVRRIVELHFGKVDVESEEGRGTTFFVNLPTSPISIGG